MNAPQTDMGRCPVIDFDHESPDHATHWTDRFESMRAECPRAWTEHHGGFWIASRYKDVVHVAKSDVFSTHKTVDPVTKQVTGGISIPGTPNPPLAPLEVDNPQWRSYRDFLNPYFGPKAAEELRPYARKIARTLIDRVIEAGTMDLVDDLTSPLPALFTLHLLGLELDGWEKFADPVHKFAYYSRSDPAFQDVMKEFDRIIRRLKAELDARRGDPREGMLSVLANGTMDGRALTEDECINVAMLLVIGGVDTTTALTSNALRYLAQNPADRQRLIADRALLPFAREEFIRYFTPVQGLARNAKAEVEIDGWQVRKGDRVLLSYASANRDEEIFADPDHLVIDRFPNRHIGFGSGIHRCIGSFHARVMFEAMVNEVLDRLPHYELLEGAEPYPTMRAVNGWNHIPVRFTSGPKLGGGIVL